MLDGLRGLAILMVVACHAFSSYYATQTGWEKWLFFLPHLSGFPGVVIFFVLSGFLVSLPFWRAREKGGWCPEGYVLKRAIRILPSLYVSIVVVALLQYFLHGREMAYIYSGLRWMVGIQDKTEFNGALWSLVVEIEFYLLLPLLFFAFRRRSHFLTGWGIFGILVVSSLVWRIFRVLTAPHLAMGEMDNYLKLGLSHMDAFAMGILFSCAFSSASGRRRLEGLRSWWIFAGLAVFILAFPSLLHGREAVDPFDWGTWERRHYFYLLCGLALLFIQTDEKSLAHRCLSLPGMVYCGAISYEWYLVHSPILEWGTLLFKQAASLQITRLTVSSISAVVGLAVAILFHHTFFLPLSHWLRARLLRAPLR